LQAEQQRGISPIPLIFVAAIAFLMITRSSPNTPSSVLTVNTPMDESNIPGVQEVHWATSRQDCKNMENRFKA
jgi:hypothetical protein